MMHSIISWDLKIIQQAIELKATAFPTLILPSTQLPYPLHPKMAPRPPSSRIIKPTPKAVVKKTSTATARSPRKGKKRATENEEEGVEPQKNQNKRKNYTTDSAGEETTVSSRKKGKRVGKKNVAAETVDDEEVEVEEPELVDLDDDEEELEEEVSIEQHLKKFEIFFFAFADGQIL
jgi:hypothetical protein